MSVEQRKDLIRQIQEHRGNSHLICCLTSDRDNAQGVIAKDFLFRFFGHLRSSPNPESLDILLFTIGGDTLAAYSLSCFVRQFAKKVGVLVPHICYSGGTLFALGADEIVMTRVATLSSIDPSIVGPLNPIIESAPGQKVPIPVGVESVAGFKDTVRDYWRLDEEGTALAFRLLCEKIHPLLIGDVYRSRDQIIRLATNLMKLHAKPLEEEKIRAVVETLATHLGSHDYPVGRPEACGLGLHVAPENPELEDLIWRLYEDFAEEMQLGVPFNPSLELQSQPSGTSIQKVLKIVMIESLAHTDVWERKIAIVPPLGQTQILSNYWRLQT